MNNAQFVAILDAQIKRVQDILVVKADEYAPDEDKLANFKRTAQLPSWSCYASGYLWNDG